MTIRRIVQLSVVLLAAAAGACLSSTAPKSSPYGYLTVVAQKAGTGYVASTIGSFFDASGLGAPSVITPWDSCRAQNYAPASNVGFGEVFPSVSAGAFIQVRLGARTDSIFPVVVGTETQYRARTNGIPYTPGDSVSIVVPGTASDYPAVSLRAKTAEAVVMQDFGVPAAGSNIDLQWTAAQDQNATLVVALRFAIASDALNAQVYCQFKDDGTGTVPARYASEWAAATNRTWVVTRVRSTVMSVPKGGYFNFISTFDLPTPAAP